MVVKRKQEAFASITLGHIRSHIDSANARRVAKIAKPTGSKLVKGPAESEKFVRWKSMKNSEENS